MILAALAHSEAIVASFIGGFLISIILGLLAIPVAFLLHKKNMEELKKDRKDEP